MIDAKFIDKSTWGDGPWTSEPDRKEWTDAATGYPCLAKRNHSGVWCGYVAVPPGHPAYGLSYDGTTDEDFKKRVAATTEALQECKGDFANVEWPERPEVKLASLLGIEVHGGLTYAGECSGSICHVPKEGEPDNVHWFGFDCHHCFDYAPAMRARMREYAKESEAFREDKYDRNEVYRDLTYVEGECASLAKQLKALAPPA